MKKILILLAGICVLGAGYGAVKKFTPRDKFSMAESAIATLYVDSVDENKLVEDAIKGMLEQLDPHSSYSNAEETRELNEPLQGNFSGIGITFNMSTDTVVVLKTVANGPSERVGIMDGDRILEANDTVIAGKKMKNKEVMSRLRGPKGSKVKLKVLRKYPTYNDTIEFLVTRDNIPIESVDAAYMADKANGVGYIRLSRFAESSAEEVLKALKELKKQGMKSLILDLTDNGGGYLNAAVDLLGEFLAPQSMAVYTEGLNSPRRHMRTNPSGKKPEFMEGRLVVMMNQYSASASEITAGAVQDWDRGAIVGRRSYGKGLVQRPIPFPDGSMIRLTTAHYYTPAGRDIQKPYNKGNSKKYNEDLKDRYDSGELMHGDTIQHPDSLKVSTLLLERTVYGGGGISPDLFVPLDTVPYTKYYRDMLAKGLLNTYVIGYLDQHRKDLKKKKEDQFLKNFEVTDEMLADFFKLGTDNGVAFNEEQAQLSTPLFKGILKALIGRDLYNGGTYFKVMNDLNPIFKEAYRLITSPDYDAILSKPESE